MAAALRRRAVPLRPGPAPAPPRGGGGRAGDAAGGAEGARPVPGAVGPAHLADRHPERKVLDLARAAARAAQADPDDLGEWFNARGKWRRPPGRWPGPAEVAERSELWGVVRRCLGKLPARTAAAFTLRVLDEAAPDEVCRALAITPANLWVLLHRARLGLVRCLQSNWFDAEG